MGTFIPAPSTEAPAFPASILDNDALTRAWFANDEERRELIYSFGGSESGYYYEWNDYSGVLPYIDVPLTPEQAIDGAAEWVGGNQRGDAWRAFVRRGQLTQHAAYLASFVKKAAADDRYASRLGKAEKARVRWVATIESTAGFPHRSQFTSAQYAEYERLTALEWKQGQAFARAAVEGLRLVIG